jgi:activator of 2-hydroxyglutaryl-CoA dehydratase
MVKKVGVKERVVFAGGGALNDCLKKLLGDRLGVEITVPESPQTIGALGAARLIQGN